MKEFEITVSRPIRIFIGIVILSIFFVGSLYVSSKLDFWLVKILIPLSAILITISFFYWFSTGRLNLGSKEGRLYFNLKRKIPFYKMQFDSIKISDIKIMVVDPGYYLKVIYINDKKIELYSGKPLKNKSKMFIANLTKQVKDNKGQIIDNNKCRDLKGSNDFTLLLFLSILVLSILFISRYWSIFEVYSLFSLILPVIFYIIHLKRRIKKR
ncbi:MAG: hypothetical protein K8R54_16280 [Bacteroidales bacterium]|nr:hypothetical protein [Bacteroidales bacterium]